MDLAASSTPLRGVACGIPPARWSPPAASGTACSSCWARRRSVSSPSSTSSCIWRCGVGSCKVSPSLSRALAS
eukprot:9499680-Pyramimonas_sp.AAC.1